MEQPEFDEQVYAWRLSELLEAEYPFPLADRIASRADIDLHVACELVRKCEPETAAGILL